MATDIAKVKITVDSTDVEDAKTDLDGLTTAADGAGREVDKLGGKGKKGGENIGKLGANSKKAGGSVRGMGRNAGMAGIQIQQLVGQIQGGQNATQALAAQAADLGIVLGAPLVGVIVALGAAVAGPLIASFFSASKSAKDLYSEIEKLSEGFEDLTEAQKAFIELEKQEALEKQRKDVAKLTKEVELLAANLDLAADGQLKMGGRKMTGRALEEYIEENTKKLIKLRAQLSTTEQQVNNTVESIDSLGKPKDDEKTPFWGDDASVSQAAFQIRMENLKTEQAERDRIAAEGQAFGQDMYQRGLQEREFAQQASNEAELEAELSHRNAMTAIYARTVDVETSIRKEAIAERMQAEIIAEKNKQKISMSLASAFSTFMQSENKALFEIGKIGAAGKAAFDAYGAINATLAQGGAFAAPAAAAIGVAAFANVTSILSSKYGSPQTSAAAIPPAPQQVDNSQVQNVNATFNIQGGGNESSIVEKIQEAFDTGMIKFKNGGVVSA